MLAGQGSAEHRVRTLFVSDLHLGCRHSRSEHLLALLNRCRPDSVYLVGDIIDGWRLRRRWRWDPGCTAVLQRLLAMGESGTRLFYTPGNHDGFLRDFCTKFDFLHVADEFEHQTVAGTRLLVTHGDRFDRFERKAAWICKLASLGHDLLLAIDHLMHRLCRRGSAPEYRLSVAVKTRVKSLVRFVSDFERLLADYARERGCDGVVCGHIHKPASAFLENIAYYNTGDWVEHSTALVEWESGRLEVVSFDPSAGLRPLVMNASLPEPRPAVRVRERVPTIVSACRPARSASATPRG